MQEIIDISPISQNDARYAQVLDLRQRVLRAPLGLDLYRENLEEEKGQYVWAAFEKGKVVGCAMVVPGSDGTAKLRQMAVDPSCQGKGVGARLLRAIADWAAHQGFAGIVLHARTTATGFYERMGYVVTGGQFEEVGIPHVRMVMGL